MARRLHYSPGMSPNGVDTLARYLATRSLGQGSTYFAQNATYRTRWTGDHPFNVIARTFR